MSNQKLAALLVAPLILAGCVTNQAALQDHTITTKSADQTNAYVDSELAQAANRSADALQTLAMIERAKSPAPVMPVDETKLPADLQKKVTLQWSGPATEALAKIAAQIGYTFHEAGTKPKTPVLVHIAETQMPAAKLLERIGTEAYPFATVTVDPNICHIELRYLANAGATGLTAAR